MGGWREFRNELMALGLLAGLMAKVMVEEEVDALGCFDVDI